MTSVSRIGWVGRVISLAVVLCLVVAACGDDDATQGSTSTTGAGSTTTTDAAASTTTTTVLDEPTEPLPLELTPDSASAVTAEIGAEGGVIEATGPDGTSFRLEFPAGALFGPVDITMTPIGSAETPFEPIQFAGVILEPDGLILFEPAELTIGLEGLVPETTAGFRSGGSGEGFHLAPVTVGEAVIVSVPHFSGAGVATSAELDTLFGLYSPTTREGMVTQAIAAIFQYVQDDAARNEAVDDALAGWLIDIGVDALAATDAVTVENLIAEFLTALDAVDDAEERAGAEMPEAEAGLVATGNDLQFAIFEVFQQENLRCIQERNPDAVFGMLRWALLAQWFHEEGFGDLAEDRFEEMDRAMRACAVFEFRFQSTADGVSSDSSFETIMSAEFDLVPPDSGALIHLLEEGFTIPPVTGTLTGAANIGGKDCASSTALEVYVDLHLDVQFGVLAASSIQQPVVWMTVPARPLWDCFPGGDAGGAFWHTWFLYNFLDNIVDEFLVFPLERTDGGETFAFGSGSAMSEGVTVTYTIALVHDPQLP